MRTLSLAGVAALAVGLSTSVQAAQVLTPDGDPFPSDAVAYLTGGPYTTPFGTFDMTTVANFDGFSLKTMGGNEYFTYATSDGNTGPTQTVKFDNSGFYTTYTLTDGDVEVEILNRSSTFKTGTFQALILKATWTGTIDGSSVVAQIDPSSSDPTTGTVTFSSAPAGEDGLLVDFSFNNKTQFSVNGGGGPFVNTPLTGVSAPIPEASAWAMMLLGFAGLGLASFRRTAGASRLV